MKIILLPILTCLVGNATAFTATDTKRCSALSPINRLFASSLYAHSRDDLLRKQRKEIDDEDTDIIGTEKHNPSIEKLGNRRASLKAMTGIAFSMLVASSTTSSPRPAWAGSLLEDFGTDPNKITQKAAAPPPVRVEKKDAAAGDSTYEPNLRSNYYYPTNKVRYLPRIKKCNDAIPLVANSIGIEDWEAVNEFALKVADDTILPMKLYTSSLGGGGTNVKVSYTKDMMNSADQFEKSQKSLLKAMKKKDQTSASAALEGMATAMLAYRTSGKLLGPDGGGDIPSVDEIRRSACRVQGRSFEKKVMERDARLKNESLKQQS